MSRESDSYIYRVGSSPNTRVAISQKNRVYSTPYSTKGTRQQVGVLSTFDWSDSRSIDPVRGVGFGDKIAELVPGVTEPTSVTLNRTMMYTSSLMQEVGYRGGVDGLVRSLRHHRWPFDLRSELVFSELVANAEFNTSDTYVRGTGGANTPTEFNNSESAIALITQFVACWMNSISASYPSDSAIIMEDCSVTCTDVTDGVSNYALNSAGDINSYGEFLQAGNSPLMKGQGGSLLYGASGAMGNSPTSSKL